MQRVLKWGICFPQIPEDREGSAPELNPEGICRAWQGREEREHSWKGWNRMSKVQRLEEVWQLQGTSSVKWKHDINWTGEVCQRQSMMCIGCHAKIFWHYPENNQNQLRYFQGELRKLLWSMLLKEASLAIFYLRYQNFESTHKCFSVQENPRESQVGWGQTSDQKVTKEGSAERVFCRQVTFCNTDREAYASFVPDVMPTTIRDKNEVHMI